MKHFHWDHKPFRRNALLAMGLVLIFLAAHEIFGEHGYLALRRQKSQYHTLQHHIQDLSKQNQQLQQKIKALKNNPETIEKQAREQLHLVRPGQFVYVMPQKKRPPQPPASAQNQPSK